MTTKVFAFAATVFVVMLVGAACSKAPGTPPVNPLSPAGFPRIGAVDERYQSYNIEMVEVTGGRFWKPYSDIDALLKSKELASPKAATPAGMDPGLYQQRPPIDLSRPLLRELAAALGPAYVRVSGTWANSTYFHDSDQPPPQAPPKGFGSTLTRPQWKGVVDFANAVGAKLVLSFAISPGTRDAAGVWTPGQARHLLEYTKSLGGAVAAAEFMNEPTFAALGGAPPGYDAAAYARDFAVFRPFAKEIAPGMLILGPGGVGEGISLASGALARNQLKSDDLLTATGPVFDAFSYHSYTAVSKRCGALGAALQASPQSALSGDFLSRTDQIEAFYAGLRDRFEPGKPLWLTETAEAACGGDPWASTFLDSFRYLDQLGRLAKRGVQVHLHNTLAASDYGLIDDRSYTPRPNYWAALMWHTLMAAAVLDPGPSPAPALHLYAHCLHGQAGGVALLAINTDRSAPQTMEYPAAVRYTLTAQKLEDTAVQLNGTDLRLDDAGAMPPLRGDPTPAGPVVFAPASITFLAMPAVNNASCR